MGSLACNKAFLWPRKQQYRRRKQVVSSCPLPATATTVSSTMPGPTATTGRVRSTRTTRTARGTSTSIRAVTAWATTSVTTGYLCVLSACPPRTKPLSGRRSRNGKTGRIGGAADGGAWRTRQCATQPRADGCCTADSRFCFLGKNAE